MCGRVVQRLTSPERRLASRPSVVPQLDPPVVVPQDLVVGGFLLGHSDGAGLRHPHAVPPPAAVSAEPETTSFVRRSSTGSTKKSVLRRLDGTPAALMYLSDDRMWSFVS